jgi:hypothetical protein
LMLVMCKLRSLFIHAFINLNKYKDNRALHSHEKHTTCTKYHIYLAVLVTNHAFSNSIHNKFQVFNHNEPINPQHI